MNRADRLAQDGANGPPVLFYDQANEWGCFSNFSAHVVTLPHPFTGEPFTYESSEHRYHAMKPEDEGEHDWVAEADGPGRAKSRGRRVKLRDDWGEKQYSLCWFVMLEAITAKALQHEDVLDALVQTGDRHIYEDSPYDDIWGWRYYSDYRGRNLLGLGWMHVRAMLRV